MLGFQRLALLTVAAMTLQVSAASAEATAPVPDAGSVAATPDRPLIKLAGFRSAHFGMTEAEVRAAITQDFSLTGSAVKSGQNPAERTRVLSAAVPDLLPAGGKAEVAYVFGYQGHALIQVGITWSKAVDPTLTPETLVSNAAALQALFLADNYKPNTVVTNAALADGRVNLLFRGQDADAHMTTLLLEGTTATAANGNKQFTPAALNLIYVVDAQHPDVMKLKPGSF